MDSSSILDFKQKKKKCKVNFFNFQLLHKYKVIKTRDVCKTLCPLKMFFGHRCFVQLDTYQLKISCTHV